MRPFSFVFADSRKGRRRTILRSLLLGGMVLGATCSTPPSTDDGPDELVGEPSRPGQTAEGPVAPQSDSVREGALWYRIALERRSLEVTLRLLRPGARSSFFLPNPGRSGRSGARPITVEGAHGPDGPVPHDQLPDEGRIDVETAGLDWIELDYRVDLEAFPNGGARPYPDVSNDTTLGFLPALLVVPSRRIVADIREIPVEVHVPKGWDLLATWPEADRSPSGHTGERAVHGYVAADVRTLRDAFFVAGPNLSAREGAEGSIVASFEPGLDVPEDRFVGLVERVGRAFRNRFGSTGPILAYARRARAGESPGLRGTAKRGGFVVRLPERRPLRASVRLLVAHEAFHLWNGHHAIPEPGEEPDIRWFEEGVTHYMAVKILFEIGLADFEDVRRQLAESAFFYRRNPASSDGRASRLDIDRLPYDRGFLLGLALDGVLHECSSGSRSIDGWIRELLRDGPTYYDADTLESTFFAHAGSGCGAARAVWEETVDGASNVEPAQLLDSVGLHYIESSTVEESKVLPIDTKEPLYESLFERRNRPAESSPSARTSQIP